MEIGPPVSTDGGLVFVARHVRRSSWFKALVPTLRTAIAGFEGQRFGFAGEEKLSRTLLALVCGFAMGYRSGKESVLINGVCHFTQGLPQGWKRDSAT